MNYSPLPLPQHHEVCGHLWVCVFNTNGRQLGQQGATNGYGNHIPSLVVRVGWDLFRSPFVKIPPVCAYFVRLGAYLVGIIKDTSGGHLLNSFERKLWE